MNPPVLSGTRKPVLSGTADPSYQEPEANLSIGAHTENRAPNFTNRESFGFLLTARVSWGLPSAPDHKDDFAPLQHANIAVTP